MCLVFIQGFTKHWRYAQMCYACKGSGKVDGKECTNCNGSGELGSQDVTDDVRIPMPIDKDDDLVENIYKLAVDVNADGIIFGAKGISSVSALFLGSIAEKMIKLDTKFPLMVVRRKGGNANIMDYIKEM